MIVKFEKWENPSRETNKKPFFETMSFSLVLKNIFISFVRV